MSSSAAASTQRPARGTRPRNRKALILTAACDLFVQHGFDQISMSELADAVAITPAALYRHVPSKQQLLWEVIRDGLTPLHQLIDQLDLTDRDSALSRLSTAALNQRHTGILLQRESRHLAPDDRARLHTQIRGIGSRFTQHLMTARPELNPHAADLLTWSTFAVLLSPAFHHLQLPRPGYDQLLTTLAATVLDTPLPHDFPAPPTPAPSHQALTPLLRREALLNQAVRLFATHGYTQVGIEDIAAAAGMSGPSIYHYFPSKADMLTTLFRRGTAVLLMDLASIHRTTTNPAGALRRCVTSYLRFSHDHPDLIGLLLTETGHLPPTEQQQARQAQHDYLNEWAHLLQQAHPDISPSTARVHVHAGLAIANNAARTPHLHHNEATRAALERIGSQLFRI